MARPPIVADSSEHPWEKRTKLSFVRRLYELRPAYEGSPRQRVVITLDELCRRDPAEVLHADHIRRHSLIDDNPSSG